MARSRLRRRAYARRRRRLRANQQAQENGIKTLAIPNISTGIYGYPKEEAAQVVLNAVSAYDDGLPEEVIFICFDEENYAIYQQLLK